MTTENSVSPILSTEPLKFHKYLASILHYQIEVTSYEIIVAKKHITMTIIAQNTQNGVNIVSNGGKKEH